jgi:hypothetical protein
MKLTDREIRATKAGHAIAKLSDGGGLQLWITPDGAKRWRLAYRHNGSQKTLAIGVYPAVSLKQAREARDEARRVLGRGQDPSLAKKLEKAAKLKNSGNTFNALAAQATAEDAIPGAWSRCRPERRRLSCCRLLVTTLLITDRPERVPSWRAAETSG